MKPLVIPATPLQSGPVLIEASAGTGKTYSLVRLLARLVLECGIALPRILAVTYTDAATAELKQRTRALLGECVRTLEAGAIPDYVAPGQEIPVLLERARGALAVFDEASIFTLHSFCQRLLGELAFEAGQAPAAELVADPSEFEEEQFADWFRSHILAAPQPIPLLAQARGFLPESLRAVAAAVRNHPDAKILPEEDTEFSSLVRPLADAWNAIAASWIAEGAAATRIVLDSKKISRAQTKYSEARVRAWAAALDAWAADPAAASCLALDAASWLCPQAFQKAELKRSKDPLPKHPIFELCGEFASLEARFCTAVRHDFVRFVRETLPGKRAANGVITFDDLLLNTRRALRERPAFANGARARFDAALVDEFQDTDPLQWEIIRTLFGGMDRTLILIGDPKQAIYSFRGADVFTYLNAKESATHRFSLRTNYRSDPALLDGFNGLFADRPGLFILEGFAAERISPQAEAADRFHHPNSAALRLIQRHPDERMEELAEAAAGDLVALLNSRALLEGRPIRPADCAVIVRKNKEAAAMQERLRKLGLPSVLFAEASVYHTPEALQLTWLLHALNEPSRRGRVRAAFATRLLGAHASAVDGPEWDARLLRVLEWAETWRCTGFMPMFRRLLSDEDVRARLLREVGGERALTNFLHLAELLHALESAGRLEPDQLLAELDRKCASDRMPSSDEQLRLESDEHCVKIISAHKSKGLEYPVVFLPFLCLPPPGDWRPRTVHYHEPATGKQIVAFDPENAPAEAEKERRSESMRLLYVAITRAKSFCQIYVQDVGKRWTATGHLLSEGHSAADNISEACTHPPGMRWADTAGEGEPIVAQLFAGEIRRSGVITSYSGLVANLHGEPADRDALRNPAEQGVPRQGIHAFPAGARAGEFFHELLEHADLSAPETWSTSVGNLLRSHRLAGPGRGQSVVEMLGRLAATTLPGAGRLSAIGKSRAEAEFWLPIRPFHGTTLAELLDNEFLASIGFRADSGYLRGFIDLLFEAGGRYHVLDWKSNLLGDTVAAYSAGVVAAEIRAQHYDLQAHLYCLAADRYLSATVPGYHYETHFGGAWYIFLRGLDVGSPGNGIWHHRPSASTIRQLANALLAEPTP